MEKTELSEMIHRILLEKFGLEDDNVTKLPYGILYAMLPNQLSETPTRTLIFPDGRTLCVPKSMELADIKKKLEDFDPLSIM